METNVKKLRRLLCDELNGMTANMCNLLKTKCVIESFARELFAAQLISSGVNDSPNYESIRSEFESTMTLFESVDKIEEHCIIFLRALERAGGSGGPTSVAARVLEERWAKVALDGMNIIFIKKIYEATDRSDHHYMPQLNKDPLPPTLPPQHKLRYFYRHYPEFYTHVSQMIEMQLKQSPTSSHNNLQDIWKQQAQAEQCHAQKQSGAERKKGQHSGNSESNLQDYDVEASQVTETEAPAQPSRIWSNPSYGSSSYEASRYANREYMTDPHINYAEKLSYPSSHSDYPVHSSNDPFSPPNTVPQAQPHASRKTSTPQLSAQHSNIGKLRVARELSAKDGGLEHASSAEIETPLVKESSQPSLIHPEEESEMVGSNPVTVNLAAQLTTNELRRDIQLLSQKVADLQEFVKSKACEVKDAKIQKLKEKVKSIRQESRDEITQRDTKIAELKKELGDKIIQDYKKKSEQAYAAAAVAVTVMVLVIAFCCYQYQFNV